MPPPQEQITSLSDPRSNAADGSLGSSLSMPTDIVQEATQFKPLTKLAAAKKVESGEPPPYGNLLTVAPNSAVLNPELSAHGSYQLNTVRVDEDNRMASDGASTTCTSEGGHGHDISSTERNIRVDENYQDRPFGFETNTGLLSQPAPKTSVRRSSGDGPLASDVHGEVERCVLAHHRTGRFDKEIEEPALTSPRAIPQVRCTDASNTSSRQNRTEGTSTANLPGEASPSASFLLPSSLFTTSQTECNFIPNISALPPFSSANTTNNNSIIQYACNFAPNISNPNGANAVHTVQIACNFTPNVSIPPSYGTSNAPRFPPPTSTVNQSRCNFTPILSNPEAATSSGAS